MCKLWTNFAKHKNPTPDHDHSLDFKWLSDKRKATLDYLLIQENPRMIENIELKRVNFWKGIYNRYNGPFDNPHVF